MGVNFFIKILVDKIKELREKRYHVKLDLQIDKALGFDLMLNDDHKDVLGCLVTNPGSDKNVDYLRLILPLFSNFKLIRGRLNFYLPHVFEKFISEELVIFGAVSHRPNHDLTP